MADYALLKNSRGFSLLRELELLFISMGRAATLRAVPSQAARHLRKQNDIGSIAPGRFADFLVVNGDPLSDIRDLRKLTAVYRGESNSNPRGLWPASRRIQTTALTAPEVAKSIFPQAADRSAKRSDEQLFDSDPIFG
jgi:cytosine/adenosine deaminase-related metal-dependent hydrolase